MNVNELLGLNPTISEFASQKMVLEIFHKTEWRCYPATMCANSEELAERFLQFHAKLPGFASREIKAIQPADVFYATDGEASLKGGIYLNGAVIIAHNPGRERSISLFIDDGVAQLHRYPEEDFVYLSDLEGDE